MDITKIPDIMRFHHWKTGASLLDEWFSRIAFIAPVYSKPNMLVTMAWVTGFKRAKDVLDQAIADRVWVNAAARSEIASRLRAKGFSARTTTPTAFGDLSKHASKVDEDYINFRAVETPISTSLDGLTAALGSFAFHFAIEGSVGGKASTPGKMRVEVKKAGIYVVDSFDFNDDPKKVPPDQFLGYWDAGDNSVSAVNPFSGDGVLNSDFRKWRLKHGFGGDFMVYSDIQVINQSPTVVFEV
jgi:hypothetical protein